MTKAASEESLDNSKIRKFDRIRDAVPDKYGKPRGQAGLNPGERMHTPLKGGATAPGYCQAPCK